MTSIKGFLCSLDGTFNFPLSPKVTTIGRENCDIIINNSNIDSQHAVIEYLENESCFVLQDLNTVNGTYINDCRVQNAAVRLAEHDTVRFGFNGIPFQFLIQEQSTMIPPLQRAKQNSSTQLQLINQTIPSRGSQLYTATNNSLWANNSLTPNATLISYNNTNANNGITDQNTIKPPISLRSRPISAGVSKKITRDVTSPKVNGWIKGFSSASTQNMCPSNSIAQELETIKQGDMELHSKLFQLEKEMKMKNIEIKELTEKLNAVQAQQINISGSVQKNELEQVKRDKSIATGLINTMQKDLTTKDATISKLAREIENLKKEVRERDLLNRDLSDRLNNMKDFKKAEEERQNKEKELLILKNKIRTTENKVIELNNNVLQIKAELDESQKLNAKSNQAEKNLKDELEHVRIQYMDMQRAERTVRIDLEQSRRMYEKFRNLIIQTIYGTSGINKPNGEVTDEDLITTWKSLIEEKVKLKEKNDLLKEKLKTSEDYHTETIDGLTELENHLIACEIRLKENGRRSNSLKDALAEIQGLELHDNLNKLKNSLCNLYKNDIEWQISIENSLLDYEIDINNNKTITDLIKSIQTKFETFQNEKLLLKNRIQEIELLHQDRLNGLVEEHKKELEMEIATLLSAQNDLKTKHLDELNHVMEEHEKKIKEIQLNSECSSSELSEKMNSLSSQLINANEEILTLKQTVENMVNIKDQLTLRLQETEEEHKIKIKELENEKHEASLAYNQDLEIYKEQIKQHSLTIVNWESNVNRMRDRELELISEIETLKRRKIEPEKPQKPATPPQNLIRQSSEIVTLEKTIENLRIECSMYKGKLVEQEEMIKTLRRDLIGATAKLTDVHGELTDKQKRELERNKALVLEQTRELASVRNQLAKLSEIVDVQSQQLESSKAELNKSKSLIEKYKAAADENGNLVLELKSKLDSGQMQLKKYETQKHEEGKIASELTAIGAQCRGERHEQVISRQREALNELRQRVKTMEQSRPLMPSHQQQMQQQIVLLKKQLAELRANQALSEDIAKQASLTRGGDENLLMLEEKTAHFETQTAFETSEETYLNLLRSVASMLDLNDIDGLKSMANLPNDEREKLLIERNRAIETICTRMKIMKESIQRKEKLLQDYELDLAKLRQTEFLLQKKSDQLDELEMNLRTKEDEIECLKESLKNARTNLDQEKIINNSIKQRRPLSTIAVEKVRRQSTDTLHHHCPPDVETRLNTVRKNMGDKIKKKEYELKVLKTELKDKQDELTQMTNRLKIVENGNELHN